MINQTYTQSKLDPLNPWSKIVRSTYTLDKCKRKGKVQVVASRHHVGSSTKTRCQDETICKDVRLQFTNLKCFETVERQYESQGVIFSNCMAIQPSNPAFPIKFGTLVLMGSPNSGLLEATFVHPVQRVKALITSSQRLLLSAYDSDRKLLTQSILAANLANSGSPIPPNALLCVQADNIHRITLCAFDGQFTVEGFSFCL
ncbi:MAG: hypothetical protein QNJ36_06575 [Calothrix sp. MO_167.B42]|nr:hypothetical protein [Calothrix sp. MO_167.B42]